MTKALEEIKAVFEKWNVDIRIVYEKGTPFLDMNYEDENGITHELDFYDRIKHYSLRENKHD